jgi:APA family basic amino acid/polyamine antiporter
MDTICNRQTQSSQKVIHSLTAGLEQTTPESSNLEPRELSRGLGLFDSIMVVVGAMIGSGIFIVPAEMARQIGRAGWLLAAWGVAGILTIAGALCH